MPHVIPINMTINGHTLDMPF